VKRGARRSVRPVIATSAAVTVATRMRRAKDDIASDGARK
jgi:hypothetical protein